MSSSAATSTRSSSRRNSPTRRRTTRSSSTRNSTKKRSIVSPDEGGEDENKVTVIVPGTTTGIGILPVKKKRKSVSATAATAAAITATSSTTTLPTKEKETAPTAKSIISIPEDCCSLGLKRILDNNLSNEDDNDDNQQHHQKQLFGPLIVLHKNMYLGRTPLKMMEKMKSFKSVDVNQWTFHELQQFNSLHKKFGKTQAPLGINWEGKNNGTNAKATATTTTGGKVGTTGIGRGGLNNKKNNSNSSSNNNRPGLSGSTKTENISRKLLQIIDYSSNNEIDNGNSSSNNTITFQRCKEDIAVRKSNNKTTTTTKQGKRINLQLQLPIPTPRIPDVQVNGKRSIGPSKKFTVTEGDELLILDQQYRYKFVCIPRTIDPATMNLNDHPLNKALVRLRQNNPPSVYTTGVAILGKILKNITDHPLEEKYQKVKKQNPAFRKRLGGIVGGHECMVATGFVIVENNDLEGGGEVYKLDAATAEKWTYLTTTTQRIVADASQHVKILQQQQKESHPSSPAVGITTTASTASGTATTRTATATAKPVHENKKKNNNNKNNRVDTNCGSTAGSTRNSVTRRRSTSTIDENDQGTMMMIVDKDKDQDQDQDQEQKENNDNTIQITCDGGVGVGGDGDGDDGKSNSNRDRDNQIVEKVKENDKDKNDGDSNNIIETAINLTVAKKKEIVTFSKIDTTSKDEAVAVTKATSSTAAAAAAAAAKMIITKPRPAFLSFWDIVDKRSTCTVVTTDTDTDTRTNDGGVVAAITNMIVPSSVTNNEDGDGITTPNDDDDDDNDNDMKRLSVQPQLLPPPPRDIPISLANIYWKALNSSRPREGAWYLNAMLDPMANNTIPSITICQEWMNLLTWGPQTTKSTLIKESKNNNNNKSRKNKNNRRGSTLSVASTTTTSSSSSEFFWDGPRLNHAVNVWKKALRFHPEILVPRMMECVPGGPSEWWKTVFCFDEKMMTEGDDENDNDKNNVNYKDNYIYFASSSLSSSCNNDDDNNDDVDADADNDNDIDIDDEKFEKEIGILRMRSVRLDVLIHLLESNIAFEEKKKQEEQEEQKKKGTVITGKMKGESEGEKPHQSNSDSDSDSDDEKMDYETKDPSSSSSSSSRYLMILLREIRVFGTKASLRVVAHAMARLWVSQRYYLGYHEDPSTRTDEENKKRSSSSIAITMNTLLASNRFSLWQDRIEIVEKLVSQMAYVLRLVRDVVANPNSNSNSNTNAVSSSTTTTNRRRSQRHIESSELTDRDFKSILWNAMDMQIQKNIPDQKPKLKQTTKRRKKKKDKQWNDDDNKHDDEKKEELIMMMGAKEKLLVDWLYSLRTSLGEDFAKDLSEHVGVSKEYGNLMEL